MREILNKSTQFLIKNERLRKKLVILFYNINPIFEKKAEFRSIEDYLFNYKKVTKNKKHICKEEYRANAYYGIAKCFKDYSGYEGKIEACIEHGVYFGDYINDRECIESGFPAVFTFGCARVEHLRKKSEKLLFAVGPYISYAHNLISDEEILSIKKKFGKTLLVFPTHSVDRVLVEMNSNQLIGKIENFKEDHSFQTVLVCLYYRDIEVERDKDYINAGYKVVTAGRREDKDFLNRLHTFFSISDYSISNNVGTHIGYSIALKVPHTILSEEVKYNTASKVDEKDVTTLHNPYAVLEKRLVREVFEKHSDYITQGQIRICERFWGLNLVRQPLELKYMLELTNDIFKKCHKKEKNFSGYVKSISAIGGDMNYLIQQAINGVKDI